MTGLLTLALVAAAVWAAIADIRTRRIPNLACAAIVVLALALAGWTGGIAGMTSALAAGLIAFTGGVIVHALGLVGAGDAKLVGALGMWTGLAQFPAFLGFLAAFALALSVLSVATRGSLRRPAHDGPLAARAKKDTIPLGVALSAAAIAATAFG
jgi:Flp pilus assembly protein protease CpaA